MNPKNLKSKHFQWFLIGVFIISAILCSSYTLPRCSASSSSSPTLFVDPAQTVVNAPTVGTTFQVNVTVANITSMFGAQYILSWNATLMACTNFTEYLYHKITPASSWDNLWILKLDVNNTAGTATYAVTYLSSTRALSEGYAPINITTDNYPPEGKLPLALLTFNVTAVPPANMYYQCNFTLSSVKLADVVAHTILSTGLKGNYTVYGPPQTVTNSVVKDSTTYSVITVSNASVVQGSMTYVANYTINFNVTAASNGGTSAYINVTIPKNLIHLANPTTDQWNVTVNGTQVTPTVTQDSVNTYLYFTTGLSMKTVTIVGTIPEFPVLTAIPLLMIATLITVGLRKRKHG
jgi:hypothetical protein